MVYFDNAATTFPKPEEVYKFMDSYYRGFGVNVGRGQYWLADQASNLVEETRTLLLELLGCVQKQVVFTPSATIALNIILRGLDWEPGSTVYITPFEHNAVLRVLEYLKNIYKLNIIELAVDKKKMNYDLEAIKYQFQEHKPNAVIVNHASNVCGLVAPIAEICRLSKSYDATTIVDMAQTAGLVPVDLESAFVDYAVFAGHKTLYGPIGIAGMILDSNTNINPFIYGGTGIDSANFKMPLTIPERFEAGSMNIQAIAGLNASLRWINSVGAKTISEQEKLNTQRLKNVLEQFDNIQLIGLSSSAEYVGVISCVFEGYNCDSIGFVLNKQGIAVRTGLHCAPNAHKFLGTFPAGTVRFSIGFFNSERDFNKLTQALSYIAENG